MSDKAAAPECLILDDSELEKAGVGGAAANGFRNWRMDASQLTASRIFGGGPSVTPAEGTQAVNGFRSFPSAFQTYKPGTGRVSGGDKRFPFFEQQFRKRMDRKDAEHEKAVAPPPPTIQIPPSPPEGEDNAPRYSQCTPPCYSPKTPPYWDASGNLIMAGQVVTENPQSKQDEQPAAVGAS